MSDAVQSTATPSQSSSIFAPHFGQEAPQAAPQPKPRAAAPPQQQGGFKANFVEQADSIAKELGVDTSAVDQADDKQATEEVDPLGDAELEIAPGKRVKRAEVAKQLAAFERMQKSQKEFERASHARMQQAADLRKQSEAQLAQAQEAMQIRARIEQLVSSGADEDTILREFGRDPDKYFQQRIEKQYADLQKTPEQRQTDELSARERALQEREQAWHQQQEHQRQQQMRQVQEAATNQHAQQLSTAFMAAADSLGLPRTQLTIQRFANAMASANQAGIPVTMEQIGSQVRDMYKQETFEMLDRLSDDDGFQSLPKPIQDKIRRSMLAKLGNQPTTAKPAGSAPSRTREQKPMSTAEYNNYILKLRTGG